MKPFHLEHVVHREPVFQAVHAARVLGHVAADGAGDLAAGIGRVVKVVRCRRLADGQVAHTALHHGRAAFGVHFQNAVELGQRQRHAHGVGHGAAREARARTARHHGHLQLVAGAQHGLHFVVRFGRAHHQRALAVGGQAVAFVGVVSSACQSRAWAGTTADRACTTRDSAPGARRGGGGCFGDHLRTVTRCTAAGEGAVLKFCHALCDKSARKVFEG